MTVSIEAKAKTQHYLFREWFITAISFEIGKNKEILLIVIPKIYAEKIEGFKYAKKIGGLGKLLKAKELRFGITDKSNDKFRKAYFPHLIQVKGKENVN